MGAQAGGAQLLKMLAVMTRLASTIGQLAPGLSPQMQQISAAVQDSMQTAMNQGQGAVPQAPPY
jgi:predicted lipid-binding transport protein (Tim44 family)